MAYGRKKTLILALCLALGGSHVFAAEMETADSRDELLRTKTAIEESLAKDPNNSELWLHKAFTLRKLEDTDAAQQAFEKVITLNPKNVDAHYMLGLIYEKKKMTSDALQAWKSVLELSTDKWRKDVAEKHIHHLSQ